MVLDTKHLEDFFKKYIAAIIIIFVIGAVIIWPNHKKINTVQSLQNSQPRIVGWYDTDKTQLDQSASLRKEAGQLADQGKYAEAIPKYKDAIDALPYVPSYTDYNDFIARTPNQSLEEKKNILGEIQGINNTMHSINYSLSFAYRDGKDIQNNYQNAITAMKNAIDEFNAATKAQDIEKQIDPNDSLIGLFIEGRTKTLAGYYSQLGDLYRLYGAYDLSVQTHKKAIDLNPDDSDARTWYGLALLADSQISLGCQQFTKALKLDETNADASKFRKQFCY